ncbi:anthocyanidin 3-O-glucosyltransferase 5-like [Cornus florida]|uniref:anthocyanidin 3-O-glucosyltransferase 5-like n=1 Tax=Cornus florida TaxID=4283 RepID=UPI00289F4E22|nr:anthocyanidin 3-O-glucosyltransferase 5-like [Cornus florida]
MKPHVAVLPSPGMGHIIPLLEFSKRLVIHHGSHVSFLVITTEASAAQNQLLRSPTLPPDLHVIDLPPADVSHLITEDTLVLTYLCLIVRESLKPLRSILTQLDRPKALIIDPFTTEAFDVCRDLSIPAYSFFTASTYLLAFSLYLPKLDREVEGEFVDLPEPVQIPGCTPMRTEDLLDQVRNRKIDEYKWFLYHVSRLKMATGIFANSWQDLEPVSLRALKQTRFFQDMPIPPVHSVGPLTKETEPMTESDTDIMTWLDKQPCESVLFVALGSGGTLSTEQLTELAWGLEMSQQRFILVARRPTDASASAAFFNVGSDVNDPAEYLPEGFTKRTEGVGLVVPSWVAQVAVLRHGSTGGFLSHCGWNSLLESIVHGVPMIAWPLYAEQRMNATMLAEEVGVAVKLVARGGERVIGREEIERLVRLVMEGEKGKVMRRRVEELQESARNVLNHGGSSYDSLSLVAESWKDERA